MSKSAALLALQQRSPAEAQVALLALEPANVARFCARFECNAYKARSHKLTSEQEAQFRAWCSLLHLGDLLEVTCPCGQH
jgi:hypothetical protein